jgi:hypothetical protein
MQKLMLRTSPRIETYKDYALYIYRTQELVSMQKTMGRSLRNGLWLTLPVMKVTYETIRMEHVKSYTGRN